MIRLAEVVASTGATDAEIAAQLDVSRQTFHRWKRERPDLREAVEHGKAAVDDRVEQSLLHRALGGTRKKIVQNGKGEIEQTVIEHVPPSDTAMIFWLKNRRPRQWRDRHETELVVPGEPQRLTPEGEDVRRMALAAIALLREAPNAPLLEGFADLVEAKPKRSGEPEETSEAQDQPDGIIDEQEGTGEAVPLDEPL